MPVATSATYEVLDTKLDAFRKAFASLHAKAVKLGCEPPVMVEGTILTKTFPIYATIGRATVRLYDEVHKATVVTLTGAPATLAGWAFLGTVDLSTPSGIPVLRSAVPGRDLGEHYRDATGVCEHCRLDRERAEVFVVQNVESGLELQVGRQCVRDFLGGVDPHDLAAMAELLGTLSGFDGESEDEDGGGLFGGGASQIGTLDYLRWVARIMRLFGWRSRSTSSLDGMSTSDVAWNSLLDAGTARKRGREMTPADYPNDADLERATAALDWAKGLSEAGHKLSDFEHNISALACGSFVRYDDIGFVGAILNAHQAFLDEGREVTNEPFGVVGERYREVRVTVDKLYDCGDTAYGFLRRVKMHDTQGRVLTWVTTAAVPEVGSEYLITFTVKGHKPFKGIMETELSRVLADKVGAGGPTQAEMRAAKRAVVATSTAIYKAACLLTYTPFHGWEGWPDTHTRRTQAEAAGDMAALQTLRAELVEAVATVEVRESEHAMSGVDARAAVLALLAAVAPKLPKEKKPAKPRAPRAPKGGGAGAESPAPPGA